MPATRLTTCSTSWPAATSRPPEALFEAYAPYLRALVRRQLSDRLRAKFDSADVVQSVWVQVVRRLGRDGWTVERRDQLRALLATIARRRLLTRVRRQRRGRPRTAARRRDGRSRPGRRSPRPSEVAQADDLWDRMLALCPPEHHDGPAPPPGRACRWPRSPPAPGCTRGASAASSAGWPASWPCGRSRSPVNRTRRRRRMTPPPSPNPRRPTSAVVERLAEEMVTPVADGERPARRGVPGPPPGAVGPARRGPGTDRRGAGPPGGARRAGVTPTNWPAASRGGGPRCGSCSTASRRLARTGPPRFPEPGERARRLPTCVAELGRGAHGRVFLAAQPSLADRPVVLKLGPGDGRRAPVAGPAPAHAHRPAVLGPRVPRPRPAGAVHAVLRRGDAGRHRPARAAAGRRRQRPARRRAEAAGPTPPPRPGVGVPGAAAAAEAVCWVGACLADALQYAHDRGLLHLDLKPSNVLLAADGTPMLLDFHLAQAAARGRRPGPGLARRHAGVHGPGAGGRDARPSAAGGRSRRRGRPGRRVRPGRACSASCSGAMAGGCDRRSVGLADILARCTARRPGGPLPDGGGPGRGPPPAPDRPAAARGGNRSVAERWRKWRRRRPLALPLALTLAALLAVIGGLVRHADRQADRRGGRSGTAKPSRAQGRYAEAGEAAAAGRRLDGVPFHRRYGLGSAKSAGRPTGRAAAGELHHLCEQVRPLYAAESLPPTVARRRPPAAGTYGTGVRTSRPAWRTSRRRTWNGGGGQTCSTWEF